ncbi:MAG: aldo/keto reductase [Smithella sp.]|jgi:predicted aldo/keto reductase-like oxidoreductase
MNRRDFLKSGVIVTTSTLIESSAFAQILEKTVTEPFVFPAPVYRILGRTGLKITIVSFGAMLTPEPEVLEIAFDHGVNYVDTARKYMGGKNEEIVGRALKGRRDKVYVATKILPDSITKEAIFKDVETSLKALDTDYLDVIQLHNLTDKVRIFSPEIREALVKLKQQGKARFFGVTTHTNQVQVLNALMEDKDKFFDTALVAYNFKSGNDLKEAIAKAALHKIGIIAMKTQAGGYQTDQLGPISPHRAALKWALQDTNVTAAIPGMRNLAELREDIGVMGLKLSYFDKLILKRYGDAVKPYYCHFCGKCEPACSKGVEISTINRCVMYGEAYKNMELSRSTYREIPAAASASACLTCQTCAAKCVNGLDIPTKMAQARKLLA